MTTTTAPRLPLDWVTIFFIGAIHGGALVALVPGMTNPGAVGVMLLLYFITGGLGITLGFHRLITHRSFVVPKWLEYFLAFCGTLACQGGPIDWVGLHRLHHLYSDQEGDPHDSNRGFWWSHMGWMLHRLPQDQEIPKYTKDINQDGVYRFLQNWMLPLQIGLGLLLFALGGWPWVIWGIFVRLVLVYHATWFVNSATHKYGYRTYDSKDRSTNCWWVALLAFGEGWHNNHHAFPHSARHGLRWWEIDVTWMMIWTLQKLGLATKVRLPQESTN
ncbi:MAG: fatty acid desaturase [Gloeomargarita sp. GMQP_bins_120]